MTQAKNSDSKPQAGHSLVTVGLAYRGRAHVLRLRPIVAAVAGFAMLLLGVWYAVATAYLVYRDVEGTAGVHREADVAARYEEKIAAMNAELQRLQSRQMVAQSTLDSKLEAIAAKQAEVEKRHEAVSRFLGGRASAGKADPAAFKPRAALDGLPLDIAAAERAAAAKVPELQTALARIEREQGEVLFGFEARARRHLAKLREGFAELRLGSTVVAAGALGGPGGRALGYAAGSAKAVGAAGGPFIPLGTARSLSFEQRLAEVQSVMAAVEALRSEGRRLPLLRPVDAEADLSSGFGPRVDPFLKRPALHTGLDFRTEHGQPITAAAAGEVKAAEWSGGYGQMVELDHGNGVETRYAHLSGLAVKAGQKIAAGAVVGYAGSTGRSTGNHLHYEVRLDGEAVDPTRFLDAGAKLVPLLR